MEPTFVFDTPEPVELVLHWRHAGDIQLRAERGCEHTTVMLDGPSSTIDDVTAVLKGSRLMLSLGKKQGFFGLGSAPVDLVVVMPAGSSLNYEIVSADLRLEGDWLAIRGQGASGDVTLPDVEMVRLETTSGDLRVGNIAGEAHIVSTSGNIELESVGGELEARTTSGDLEVSGSVALGAQVTTSSGNIHLANVGAALRTELASGDLRVGMIGGPLTAGSLSGNLEVDTVFGPVKVQTVSGDVTICQMPLDGPCTVRTVSGNVQLGLPADTKVWTDLSTLSGEVYTDIERQGEPADGEAYLELRITSVSGDISLVEAHV